VLFAAGLTIACTMLFGLVPALHLTRTDLQRTLRVATDRRAPSATRACVVRLLATQIALSVVLLVCAGLLIRSFANSTRRMWAFAPDGLSVVTIDLRARDTRTFRNKYSSSTRCSSVLRAFPVSAAVAGTTVAPTGSSSTWSFRDRRRPATNPSGRGGPAAHAPRER